MGSAASQVVVLTHGGDVAGLLDDVGAEKAVTVGHGWGSAVATNFPLFHPDRVSAVLAISVPPSPAHRRSQRNCAERVK